MNWLERRETPCQECGATQWQIACTTNKGGHQIHPMFCGVCGYRSMVCVPKAIMKNHALRAGVNLEYSAPPEDTHACEVCGHLGTERHHWAPYYLFGNESEAWPKSFLCQACHAKWHRIIASQQAIA